VDGRRAEDGGQPESELLDETLRSGEERIRGKIGNFVENQFGLLEQIGPSRVYAF
jgi:hypothetical protein